MKATILGVGVLLAVAVGAFLVIGLLDDDSGLPPREALIEALADDPDTTLDRAEAGCVLAAIEALGVDTATIDRDGLESSLPRVLTALDRSQYDRLDGCLDAESRARIADQLLDADNAELRAFVADFLNADPVTPLPRVTADCVAEALVGAEVVDDLVTAADGPISDDLAAALLAAETECP